MSESPLISIIIPSYNRAHTLKRALDSILAQDYRPLEIIVIDDASTDNTQQFISQYKIQNHFERGNEIAFITSLNMCNLGIGASRNVGLGLAQGEYIAFLDSDDEWIRKEKLSLQAHFLQNNPDYGFVATGSQCNFPKNDFMQVGDDKKFRDRALFFFPFPTFVWFFRSSLLSASEGFRNYLAEDYEFLLRICRSTKVYCLPICTGYYHIQVDGNHNSNIFKSGIITFYIIWINRKFYPFFYSAFFARMCRGFYILFGFFLGRPGKTQIIQYISNKNK